MMHRHFFYSLTWLFFLLLWGCGSSSDQTAKPSMPMAEVPERVMLSELPDSLAPQVFLLEAMPVAPTIRVPRPGSRSYLTDESGGVSSEIVLQAPTNTPLPRLTGPDGSVVLGKDGEAILMGRGGLSQFKTYTTEDGLAQDAVNCSLMDSRGHLWFGTNDGGVSRFDGTTFTTYTSSQGLAGNSILSILEDREGNIWFGTLGNGISKFDGKVFTNYSSEDGRLDNGVYDLLEDKSGAIWVASLDGLSKFENGEFTHFSPEDGLPDYGVLAVLEDQEGFIWIGTFGGGLSRYDGNTFVNFDEEDGLPGNRIRSLFQDQKGRIWIGVIGAGLVSYDGKEFLHYDQQDGLAGLIVRAIIENQAGDIWVATNEGASKFSDGEFVSFRRGQGLADDDLQSVVEDRNGRLWFSTEGGGVSRFDGEGFTTFSTRQGLGDNLIMSITEDQRGNLWFGTVEGGVSRFDGAEFEVFSMQQGLASSNVPSVFEDTSGFLWFATGGAGVSRYNGNLVPEGRASFTNFSTDQGLAGNDVFSILEDRLGKIWIGTDGGGLSVYDGKSFTNFTTRQGLAGDAILGLAEDHLGNIWIAAIDGGLSMYDGDRILSFGIPQGLVDQEVSKVKKDSQDNLWIATQHGLSFLSKKNLESFLNGEVDRPLFENFTSEDGLPNDKVLQIAEMPNGKIAIGTGRGISLFDAPAPGASRLDSLANLEIFNSQFGFPAKDLTDGQDAMFVDSDGLLWAGTGSTKTALVSFDYSSLLRNAVSPEVFIKNIQINETPISWYNLEATRNPDGSTRPASNAELTEEVSAFGRTVSDKERREMLSQFDKITFDGISPFFALPQNLILPYKNNQVNIDFGTNELSLPDLVEYRYFLEGYDQDWSPVIKKSSATFGNIQEGDYTFSVMARFIGVVDGEAGSWSDPVSFSFTVLPPWYRSWWAFLIYGVLFVSLFYPFSQYQKQQVIKKEQEKARERELAQAREIEKAYTELEASHENLKSTQSQLIQSEKMASLGELTAGIAHEIQNPLNFVNNFSEVSKELMEEMEEELAKGDPEEIFALAKDIKDNLERISSHGRRADSIVKAMLQHSRTGSGNKEQTDINALADECLRLSYHAIRSKDSDFRGEYALKLDPTLPKVVVIPQDIGKVFLNVTSNAFYAVNEADQAGREEAWKPLVTIQTKSLNNAVEILVIDNGSGVADDIREKIFQPFFTTKPTGKGTGLGLSLSYDIIKAHGGELKIKSKEEVESGDERGTVFSIILPFKS